MASRGELRWSRTEAPSGPRRVGEHNGPQVGFEDGSNERRLLNLQHSFEMLLKAGLVHRGVRGGKLPAHDPPAVDVDHEAQEDRALPAAQVGEVRDPELVWPRSGSPVARRA